MKYKFLQYLTNTGTYECEINKYTRSFNIMYKIWSLIIG